MSAYKITPEKYNGAKILLESGLSLKQTGKTVGLSVSTLFLVRKSTSLDHYKELIAELTRRQREKISVEKPAEDDNITLPVVVSNNTNDLEKILQNISYDLQNIYEKLDWLSENVAIPKRTIFHR